MIKYRKWVIYEVNIIERIYKPVEAFKKLEAAKLLKQNPEVPLQKIPDVEQNSPYNHFGRRKQKDARVKLILRRNPDDMQRRKELVEHPFGTIKWYDGAHYFLCRGKEKVSAEIALSFLTYNLRRAIKLLDVGALVAHFTRRKQENRG